MKPLSIAVGLIASLVAATCDAHPAKLHRAATPTGAVAIHPIPADGPLNEADLLAIARLGDNAAPRDAFSKPELSPYAGREFSFTRKAGWDYDVNTETLTIRFIYIDNHIKLSDDMIVGGSYAAENVFGATTRVQVANSREYELRTISSPQTGGTSPSNWYESKVQLNPGEARSLAQHLDVLIEGRTAPDGGDIAYCSDDEIAPTLSTPIDFHDHTCEVTVSVSHIAIRDSSSGRVLAEWSAQP